MGCRSGGHARQGSACRQSQSRSQIDCGIPEGAGRNNPVRECRKVEDEKSTPQECPDIHATKPVPVMHPSWWIGGAVLILFVLAFIRLLVTNENLQWGVVAAYMFSPE